MPVLNWIGKEAVEKHHLEIPYRLLEYDESLSAGDQESGNLLIQGDNLHALKALLPYYSGKVKCIYIDPPYNTGNEGWQYNDNVNSPEIKEWLNKVVGPEGEDLSRHDKWLCMMYPRLSLLKKFLRHDGAIFISIDDNEQANLKLLMNDIFGESNFIATVIWHKRYAASNDAKGFSNMHDYILVYQKSKSFNRNLLPRTAKQNVLYKYDSNDGKGLWRPDNLSVKTYSKDYDYPIQNVRTGKVYHPPKGRCWVTNKSTINSWIDEGRVFFGKDGEGAPQLKRYLNEVQNGVVPLTYWHYDEVGHTDSARKELKLLFNNPPFDNPKPTGLIKRILNIATDKNDIVLDSFAGSGTTGQAVLGLNKEDNGNRKFILVEIDQSIAKEVTAERLKRVVNGYSITKSNDKLEAVEGFGGGFRYCKLGEPLFDRFGNVRKGVKFKELARHIFFSETGNPLPEKAKLNSAKIGVYKGVAYYLLFNGILGDKSVNGGNVLTSKVLTDLPKFNGPKIIFGEANRLSQERLKKENIIFKQIPYAIKSV